MTGTESCMLYYTDLVELVVDFVEDERSVIVSCVQFNNLVNWRGRQKCEWGRRDVVVGEWESGRVGGWESGRMYEQRG